MNKKIISKGFIKKEGKTLNINKKVLGDQKCIEVGNETDKKKIDNTIDFDTYKDLYKDTINQKFIADYGDIKNKKLWEDTAKELYMQSAEYLPVDQNATEDLSKKTESKTLVEKSVDDLNNAEFNDLEKYLQQMIDNGLSVEQVGKRVREYLDKLDNKECPKQ